MIMITNLIHFLEKFKHSVKLIRIHERALLPARQTDMAAGYDLSSVEDLEIPPHGRALVHTGWRVSIPPDLHIEIRPRSGLALKHGITVLNTPGTIDPDYRGEMMILLFNTSDTPYTVHSGDRIAQAVLMRHCDVTWKTVSHFDTTRRDTHGFGSTGNQT